MTPEILHVTAADGATAELIVHPSPQGEFVYWLPALGVTARHYARFAEALAAEGIGLARHEWRGAGSSNLRARRGVDWRYRDLLADIRDGLAALRVRHPDARIWIGGHSLGAQFAALAALTGPQDAVQAMLEEYAERRAYLMGALTDLGMTYGHPGGAFYIYTNVSSTGLPSPRFCEELLRQARVMIFPGSMFGDDSDNYVRISYLQPLPRIKEAVGRMSEFIRTV